LKVNLARADQFETDFVKKVEEFILKTGMMGVPEETLPALKDGYGLQEWSELDLKEANITTVIWATGYSFDFRLVRLPIFDADGYPIQKRGITKYPGLYFVGLPWLHNAKSGLLFGVAQDAEHIVSAIDEGGQRPGLVRRKPKHRLGWHYESEFAAKVAPITELSVRPRICRCSSLPLQETGLRCRGVRD